MSETTHILFHTNNETKTSGTVERTDAGRPYGMLRIGDLTVFLNNKVTARDLMRAAAKVCEALESTND